MITAKKLNIYKSFDGNYREWSRNPNAAKNRFMTETEWRLIENLIRELQSASQDFLSGAQQIQLEKRLKDHCEDSRTIQLLRQMAAELG